jgi:hypothetical protein
MIPGRVAGQKDSTRANTTVEFIGTFSSTLFFITCRLQLYANNFEMLFQEFQWLLFTWWCAVKRLVVTTSLMTVDGTATLDHCCAGGNWILVRRQRGIPGPSNRSSNVVAGQPNDSLNSVSNVVSSTHKKEKEKRLYWEHILVTMCDCELLCENSFCTIWQRSNEKHSPVLCC